MTRAACQRVDRFARAAWWVGVAGLIGLMVLATCSCGTATRDAVPERVSDPVPE